MIRNLIGRVRAYEAAPVHPLQAVAGVVAIVVGLSVLRRYVAESGEELAGLVGETYRQTRQARQLAKTLHEEQETPLAYPAGEDLDPLGNGHTAGGEQAARDAVWERRIAEETARLEAEAEEPA